MLWDTLENWQKYEKALPDQIVNALMWLGEKNLKELENGKYEINSTDFAIVQEYETRKLEESEYENHRKFVDIQYMVIGEEWIYHSTPINLKKTKEYSDDEDIEFYDRLDNMVNSTKLVMKEKCFSIFWPGDCHMPCINPIKKQY